VTATLRVDLDDPTPPYEQLRRQLVGMIAAGDLRVGDRLPPLRQLAGDLGLAVGTVARSYRELEAAGLVTSRRGGGTRVAATPAPPDGSGTLGEEARHFAHRAASLGVGLEDAVRALRDAWS
jgi:GntR family transcriptional regulator